MMQTERTLRYPGRDITVADVEFNPALIAAYPQLNRQALLRALLRIEVDQTPFECAF